MDNVVVSQRNVDDAYDLALKIGLHFIVWEGQFNDGVLDIAEALAKAERRGGDTGS